MDRNGQEKRYIIDYYFNPGASAAGEALGPDGTVPPPPKSYAGAPPVDPSKPRYTGNIHVDVRPAVDDLGAALDRLRRFPGRAWEAIQRPKFRAEGLDPAKSPKEAAALSMLHSSNTMDKPAAAAGAAAPSQPQERGDPEVAGVSARCRPHLEALQRATSESERQTAHVGLTYCMATSLCPGPAAAFMGVLEKGDAAGDSEEEAAFDAMNKCVVGRMVAAQQGSSGSSSGAAKALQ